MITFDDRDLYRGKLGLILGFSNETPLKVVAVVLLSVAVHLN
jgi:hypothetical protein